MATIISAFIYLSTNSNTSLESYIAHGIKLLKRDIQKIIFIDENVFAHFEEYQNAETVLIKTKLEDLYLYKYKDRLKNLRVNTNNITKDTFEYFVIQCNKTEWVREAISLHRRRALKEGDVNPIQQFIWIDFGIYHVLTDDVDISTDFFKHNYDNVRIPSIWNLDITYNCDYKRDIMWYFAGGVFGGAAEKLVRFADLTKQTCLAMIENEAHLMWEVNIWYLVWMDNKDLFNVYKATHDSSIIINYKL